MEREGCGESNNTILDSQMNSINNRIYLLGTALKYAPLSRFTGLAPLRLAWSACQTAVPRACIRTGLHSLGLHKAERFVPLEAGPPCWRRGPCLSRSCHRQGLSAFCHRRGARAWRITVPDPSPRNTVRFLSLGLFIPTLS